MVEDIRKSNNNCDVIKAHENGNITICMLKIGVYRCKIGVYSCVSYLVIISCYNYKLHEFTKLNSFWNTNYNGYITIFQFFIKEKI